MKKENEHKPSDQRKKKWKNQSAPGNNNYRQTYQSVNTLQILSIVGHFHS